MSPYSTGHEYSSKNTGPRGPKVHAKAWASGNVGTFDVAIFAAMKSSVSRGVSTERCGVTTERRGVYPGVLWKIKLSLYIYIVCNFSLNSLMIVFKDFLDLFIEHEVKFHRC